ncbi:hypothetical protein FOA52_005636 [Chlamydomonas sp. UWO 241]|nr:hypothetical protein FOA52_005636 [Chlamydomonas sp. UWO 241]
MALSMSTSRMAASSAVTASAHMVSARPSAAPCMLRKPEFAPSCPFSARRGLKIVARSAAEAVTPTVKIDNLHDAFATIIRVDVGEATELLDTITALKSLGLNIRKAKLGSSKAGVTKEFYVTEAVTSEKIVKSARLEEIRQTVLASLQETFPDSGTKFNVGPGSGYKGRVDGGDSFDGSSSTGGRALVKTTIDVNEADNGSCSVLTINTQDRPGLLVDIVRVLKDVNLNVVSAEVDTIGTRAHDEFFVTYKGEPLTGPMTTLVINSLNYYLSLNEVATVESY